MKRIVSLWLTLMLLPVFGIAEETVELADEAMTYWVEYDYKELTVGNATPMEGKFFTSLWGGTTSDMDVQELLHGYNLVKWDSSLAQIRPNHSVVSGAMAGDDELGNRTYYLALYDDLYFSDGTPITASDYAFSLLLQIDPVINALGGKAAQADWMLGAEEYLRGDSRGLSGLRVIDDQHLRITAKAEALPYFFELSRLSIKPYPIHEIAPGCQVRDDGDGAYLTEKLREDTLRQTILDPDTGYLTHPKTVSGPYTLAGFDGVTAHFVANDYYKGDENSHTPQIWDLYYTKADNKEMIRQLGDGEFGLLNKVTLSETLYQGIKLAETQGHQYTMRNYPRTGLTMLWFALGSHPVQETAVRKAIAYCLDRERFVRTYVGPFGLVMDVFCGLGQWTYGLANGTLTYSMPLSDSPTPAEERAYEETMAAWEEINLDGVEQYGLDVEKAIDILTEAGWTLNEQGGAYDRASGGVRYKQKDGALIGLNLTLGIPDSQDTCEAMETYFLPTLLEAGIQVTLRKMDMESLQRVYLGDQQDEVDLIYLGENFSIIFDPDVFYTAEGEDELTKAHRQLNAMARDMVRTEHSDLTAYMQKWVKLQEEISRSLPLIPMYSNVYFDFYTRELYDYNLSESVTWTEAVIPAYMSEPETYDDETNEEIESELEELESMFKEDRYIPLYRMDSQTSH